jgi:chemotaxis protein methyltransferase WspC
MTAPDFSGLLKRAMGLDANSIGTAAVARAVRQRAMACTQGDETAYWEVLAGSAREQQELIETVVVPETSFFRHAESMETLSQLARQRVAHGKALRILSLPCSSGEEPYTIAMALLDAGVDPERYTVLGLDISERLVARAEQGIYGRNAFRGDELGFRARHFTETPQGYSVAPRVRAHVRFQTGNILDPALALPSDAYDFVFCRNLLIYFDDPTQQAAVRVLRRLCRTDGVIFVGPAEASLLTRLGMRQIDAPRAFAFQNTSVEAIEPAAAPGRARGGPGKTRSDRAVPPSGRRRFMMADPGSAPRAAVPAAPRTPARSDPPAAPSAKNDALQTLAAIQSLADAGRLDEARVAAKAHIQGHGASAEAYYLLALLDDAAGLPTAAEAAYRKTLYLDPGHRQALLHLASLLETRGERAQAGQLRARAARRENSDA